MGTGTDSITDTPVLSQGIHFRPLPREYNPVLVQVGWIGQTGAVYALDDQPMDPRESGGFSPLLLAVGVWEHLGDGRYGIKD